MSTKYYATASPALRRRLLAITSLAELKDAFKIPAGAHVIIGDGSGTRWDQACGWGCILYPGSESLPVLAFHGGMNFGTNVVAEMMAYLQPLLWLTSVEKNGAEVHIITDAEYVRNAGADPKIRQSNLPLWAAMEVVRRVGISVKWHWAPRDLLGPNKFSHLLANMARKAQVEVLDTVIQEFGQEPAQILHTGCDALYAP